MSESQALPKSDGELRTLKVVNIDRHISYIDDSAHIRKSNREPPESCGFHVMVYASAGAHVRAEKPK